jgi:ABC-type branched-subunit amino acid transport system substrate-binding protein
MRNRFPILALLMLVVLLVSVTPIALAGPFSSPNRQSTQTVNIGILGPSDGPTAQGVLLAVQRINAAGPVTGVAGVTYTLNVLAGDVRTPEDVTTGIGQLKQANAVAIFGPDDDGLATRSSAALVAAGIPVFTGATTNALNTTGLVFRTRASDNFSMTALTDFMLTDLKKSSFAIFQGSEDVSGAVGQLVQALTCDPGREWRCGGHG